MSGQGGTRGPLAVGYVHDGRGWAAGRLTADQAEWMVARLQERGCTGFVIRDGLEYARALLPPGTRVIAPRKHWGNKVGAVLDGYEVSPDGEQALVRFDDGPEITWSIRGLDAVAAPAGASLPAVTVEQRRPGGAWAVRRDGSFLSADGTWGRPPHGQAGDRTWHEARDFPLREALVLAARHAPAFRTSTTAPADSPFFPFEQGPDFADYVILARRHAPVMNHWSDDGQWQLTGDDTAGYALTWHAAPGDADQTRASVVPCPDRGGWHSASARHCDDAVLSPSARSALIVDAPDPTAVAAIAVLWPGTAPEANAPGPPGLPRQDEPAAAGRTGRPGSPSGSAAAPGVVEGPLRKPAAKTSASRHRPAGSQPRQQNSRRATGR